MQTDLSTFLFSQDKVCLKECIFFSLSGGEALEPGEHRIWTVKQFCWQIQSRRNPKTLHTQKLITDNIFILYLLDRIGFFPLIYSVMNN